MKHFFNKKRLFPILIFGIGVLCSCLLANSLNKKFLTHKEILIETELERKIRFLQNAVQSETTKTHSCLFEALSPHDECARRFILHEGLWLYDMRIFRNDTLMFEKNINPEIAWNAWTEGQTFIAKNSVFMFDLKPTKEHLEFLKSDFPLVILFLGIFISFAFASLIWFYQLLFKKKEELRKAKNEICLANTNLQKKNNELEEYVNAVSHDLQEPLNTINGFIEVLQEDHQSIFDNKELAQCFTLISDASSRMKTVIKELLVYAKLGEDRNPELVNLDTVVEETLLDLTQLIKESDAIINLPDSLPTIKGYRLELKLLFQNLLINAIKYQKAGTKPMIDISFKKNRLESKFTIKDNGIGIDEKYQNTIFKLFNRLHSSSTYPGSGIGLAKCKKILDLHNGAIWVESTPWQGSKFHFVIPNS